MVNMATTSEIDRNPAENAEDSNADLEQSGDHADPEHHADLEQGDPSASSIVIQFSTETNNSGLVSDDGMVAVRLDSGHVEDGGDEDDDASLDSRSEDGNDDGDNAQSSHPQEPHRNYIRRLSRLLLRADTAGTERTVDNRRLSDCLREARDYSYGIEGVEVYLLDEKTGKLVWTAGYRSHKIRKPFFDESECSSSNFFKGRSTEFNSSDMNGPPVEDVVPGAGLVGTLWSAMHVLTHAVSQANPQACAGENINAATKYWPPESRPTQLVWRDLASIHADPDTLTGPRLELLLHAGVGLAAGVPFNLHALRGLVVYYAPPADTVDEQRLYSVANETYLIRSTSYIGSCVAMAEARRACVAYSLYPHKPHHSTSTKHTLATVKDVSSRESEDNSPGLVEPAVTSKVDNNGAGAGKGSKRRTLFSRFLPRKWKRHLEVWYSKCWGGGLQIPPRMEPSQVLWTIFGSFCGLLVLSAMNRMFTILTEDEFSLVIGPFGALMTLQYALTAAPASQPRNAILGQALAGAVSMSFTYIPTYILPVWIRQAVGPAFAIGAMTAAGFPHPPAGAHSVIWAGGKHGWPFYAIVVLGAIVSVLPAVVVNNMSDKRQYPTFWGYIPQRCYMLLFGDHKKTVQKEAARQAQQKEVARESPQKEASGGSSQNTMQSCGEEANFKEDTTKDNSEIAKPTDAGCNEHPL